MIKVSVIIPVYNAEKYLRTALDSVVCQTLKNIEIICVDDGSTDNSFAILQEYAERDHRFVLLQQEHQYAGIARNYGMSVAKGEYLSFLDADDYFKPDMLEKAYQCAKKEVADVVVFGMSVFKDDYENSFPVEWGLYESRIPDGNSFKAHENSRFLLNFTNTAAWNKLFRTTFIKKEKLRFQATQRWNDVSFVMQTLALSNSVGLVRDKLIYYRIENTQSLQGTREEGILDSVTIFCETYHMLEKKQVDFEVINSFRNQCLLQMIGFLQDSISKEVFVKLYDAIKYHISHELHFSDMKKKDFHEPYLYHEFRYIQEHTDFEYIFHKYKDLEIANRTLEEYIFPFEYVERGSRIILYGAGKVGHAYYRQIRSTEYCTIAAWVDQRAKKFHDSRIGSIDEINCHDVRHLVIALGNETIAVDVRNVLIETYGLDSEKIIWRSPRLK